MTGNLALSGKYEDGVRGSLEAQPREAHDLVPSEVIFGIRGLFESQVAQGFEYSVVSRHVSNRFCFEGSSCLFVQQLHN